MSLLLLFHQAGVNPLPTGDGEVGPRVPYRHVIPEIDLVGEVDGTGQAALPGVAAGGRGHARRHSTSSKADAEIGSLDGAGRGSVIASVVIYASLTLPAPTMPVASVVSRARARARGLLFVGSVQVAARAVTKLGRRYRDENDALEFDLFD